MTSSKPQMPSAIELKYCEDFDAWNSTSKGHQTAENRPGSSVGWRQYRSVKLNHQFRSGATRGKRSSDLQVGARSNNWGEKAECLPKDVKPRALVSVADMLLLRRSSITPQDQLRRESRLVLDIIREKTAREPLNSKRRIFDGLTIYVNGCTKPQMSDHKLKHLLAKNGAKIAISLSRKQVTHVILGSPCSKTGNTGVGGGLAGTKIQREIMRIGGCGVRYVCIEWVLESLKAGIRLPEARFSSLMMASIRQRSVYGAIFQVEDNTARTSIKGTVEATPNAEKTISVLYSRASEVL